MWDKEFCVVSSNKMEILSGMLFDVKVSMIFWGLSFYNILVC